MTDLILTFLDRPTRMSARFVARLWTALLPKETFRPTIAQEKARENRQVRAELKSDHPSRQLSAACGQSPLAWKFFRFQRKAAKKGYLSILKWVKASGGQLAPDLCDAAASRGELAVLKWSRKNGGKWDPRTAAEAAFGKRRQCGSPTAFSPLRTLQWLREPSVSEPSDICPWCWSTCAEAARGGQLEVFEWAKGQKCRLYQQTLVAAAEGGNLDIVKLVYERVGRTASTFFIRETSATAARLGHLEVVKWLSETDAFGGSLCSSAAEGGQLEILKWLRQSARWTPKACARVCSGAAGGGHLEALKWARENGCPWDEETCGWAARGGHLETLKWLRQMGCPWDEWACTWAATHGHFETLKWAFENGCQMGDSALEEAILSYDECSEYDEEPDEDTKIMKQIVEWIGARAGK